MELHFGQASFDAFAADAMSAPLVQAATRLMQALIEASEAARDEAPSTR